ncbi:MAG: O-antigen ligase family protein, partial [Congregibacter sp.]|nr:O-antigen ligase family protein [Congregibacter sp.]
MAIVVPPGALFESPYGDQRYGYNVVKGLIWAAFLTPLWLELRKADAAATLRVLFIGAAIGSLALLTVIFWERGSLAAFAQGGGAGLDSLINLSTGYRTIGLFSNMRTGGEALDGTIILLLAICAYGAFYARPRFLAWLSRTAVVGLAYVTLVGFTRATYAAFALLLMLLIALEVYRYRAAMNFRIVDVVVVSSLLPALFVATYLQALLGTATGLALLVASEVVVLGLFARFWLCWPLRRALLPGAGMILLPLVFAVGLTAGTMGDRMQSVDKSLDTRLEHWMNVWEIGRREPGGTLFGHGAGSFPAFYEKYFPEKVRQIGAATVQSGTGVLRLEGGGDLLFAQRLALVGDELRIDFSIRAPQGGRLSIALCARNILDTARWGGRCDTHIVALRP